MSAECVEQAGAYSWWREDWREEGALYFYGSKSEGWFLSNFAHSPLWMAVPFDPELGRCDFPTAEHAFQAHKAQGFTEFMSVWQAPTPGKAKRAGGRVRLPEDWEQRRAHVMLAVLRAKFERPEFREMLLATGERLLCEDSPRDDVWGCRDGAGGYSGRNLLGRALMRVRHELRPAVAGQEAPAGSGHRGEGPAERVLVCGSRGWSDPEAIRRRLCTLASGSTVVAGGARGADQLAAQQAAELGMEVEVHAADWRARGRSAGFERNVAMLASGVVRVIAFADPCLEQSAGTRHCVEQARRRGIAVEVHEARPGQGRLALGEVG